MSPAEEALWWFIFLMLAIAASLWVIAFFGTSISRRRYRWKDRRR